MQRGTPECGRNEMALLCYIRKRNVEHLEVTKFSHKAFFRFQIFKEGFGRMFCLIGFSVYAAL